MTRRVLALRAEYELPADFKLHNLYLAWLLFDIGRVYVDLECGHSQRLYQKHWGEFEQCVECEAMAKQAQA